MISVDLVLKSDIIRKKEGIQYDQEFKSRQSIQR